ncbi:MAG: PRC-barrel domain-containing protein, partial [Opitutus sp.]
YYNWPVYPGAIYMLDVPPPQPPAPVNPHLYSTNSVTGYHLEATDGDIGHVADFLFDEATWSIAFLEINTRNWLPGRHVLLATEWVRHLDWHNSHLEVDLTCAAINSSPAYDANRYITQEYIAQLKAHYGSSAKPGST